MVGSAALLVDEVLAEAAHASVGIECSLCVAALWGVITKRQSKLDVSGSERMKPMHSDPEFAAQIGHNEAISAQRPASRAVNQRQLAIDY